MEELQTLIGNAQNNDLVAFQTLVKLHQKNVYYLALDLSKNPSDAQDITQEVFIRAFRYIKSFRQEAKFSSWLYRITVNYFMETKRKKELETVSFQLQSNEETESAVHQLPDDNITVPGATLDNVHLQKRIKKALVDLTDRERSVFVLRHYQEMSLKEISETLDVTVGTVKSLLFRAIQRLQKSLAGIQIEL